MKLLLSGLLLIITINSFGSSKLETVPFVDLDKYTGRWYEIARYKNRFQRNCAGTMAEYSREKNYISVKNSCQQLDDASEVDSSTGYATLVKDPSNAKLKVSFVPFFGKFGWFSGNYWIIELGENYEYAVIGEPSRKYLWILSRSKTLPESTYTEILNRLDTVHHYDTSKLFKSPTWL